MIAEREIRDAIMRATGLVIVRDKIELSINDIQKIIDVLPEVTGDFPITSVCRDDLTRYNIDIDKVTDSDMACIADKMCDDYCDQLYWESLGVIVNECMSLPKIGEDNEEDDDYNIIIRSRNGKSETGNTF